MIETLVVITVAGGVNVGFLNGSVRFIRDGASPLTWGTIGTNGGGEVVDMNNVD